MPKDKQERNSGVLTDLDLDEVSFVDVPANPHCKILLTKRADQFTTEEEALEAAEKALRASNFFDMQHKGIYMALHEAYKYEDDDGIIQYPHISAVFKDNVVFSLKGQLYRCKYSKSSDGAVMLEGDKIPVEVVYADKSASQETPPPEDSGITSSVAEDLTRNIMAAKIAAMESRMRLTVGHRF